VHRAVKFYCAARNAIHGLVQIRILPNCWKHLRLPLATHALKISLMIAPKSSYYSPV
jgi:hypothetical protein